MSGQLTGGSIRILWDADDSAEVTITGGVSSWTVNGSAVTFPYTLSSSTTFETAHSGTYTVSVEHHGHEVANTPDGTREVELRFGEQAVFEPTVDDTGGGQWMADLHRELSATYATLNTDALNGALVVGYGHSYVAGTGATTQATRFIERFGTLAGASAVSNRGVAGDESYKMLRRLIPTATAQDWSPGTKALVVVDCVLNDVLHTTETDYPQDLIGFTNAMRTAFRVLRAGSYVPCTDASITYGGTWTDASSLNGSRTGTTKQTGAIGATATIAGYTPTEITLMVMAFPGAQSSQTAFEVSVGGTVYDGRRYCGGLAAVEGYQINAYRFTGLPTGAKSVVVTNVDNGGTASKNLYIDGYLTPSTSPPTILAVRDAELPAYNTSPFNKARGDELLGVFNDALSAVVAEAEFKRGVQTIDVDAGVFYNPAAHIDFGATNDLHRNDAGYEALAQALLRTAITMPRRSGMH